MSAPPLTYAFLPDEEISRGFVRILGEISSRGRDLTRHSSKPPDKLIHEGRLLIKRVRALLWFAHPALDSAAYTRARMRLRKAAGLLAGQRDLAVMQATFEELEREASPSARNRAAVAQIFLSLTGNPPAGIAPEETLRRTLQEAMGILCRSVNEIKRNTPRQTAWPSPSQRPAKAFRAMLRAGKKARRTEKDADYDAWRKKAKRLLYQLESVTSGRAGGLLF